MTPLTVKVLDHGIVSLIDTMGSDLSIVNAAQASLDRQSEAYGPREQAILRKLMQEEHGVPFEHVLLTFKLRLPIFVARQFVKHRMSSWSECSARYSEMGMLFYTPTTPRKQVGKAMSYTYEDLDKDSADRFIDLLREASADALYAYHTALSLGVAKEHARLVLPMNLYTTAVWTMNLRGLFNFLHLRNDPHAQAEAQVYAGAMETLAATTFPDAIRAFIENGRKAP